MKVVVTKNFEESTKTVANMIIEEVKRDSKSKLGLATGGTAEAVYPHLVSAYEAGEVSFKDISTVNLDEYIGIAPDNEQSYRRQMNTWFFDKTDVKKEKTFVACGINPVGEEIKAFNKALYGDKLIDLQLLGVGVSGHVGFNEPGDHLVAGVHIEKLTQSTIDANARFFDSPDDVPRESITMGIGDIMKAKKIILIATGDHKAMAIGKLLNDDEITSKVPVTILKAHRDATIVIDEALAEKVGYTK